MLLALSGAGCEDAPVARLQNAKDALEHAATAGAVRYSEQTYRQAEELLQTGWMELARQNGHLAPFRSYAKADSLLQLATTLALQAETKTTDSLSSMLALTNTELTEMKDELAEWLEALNGSLAGFNVKDYWLRAELNIQIAEGLMKKAEYDDARVSMAKARTFMTRLGKILEAHADDEAKKIGVWRRWVQQTLDQSRSANSYALIVDKAAHRTYLVKSGRLIHSYPCELGYNSSRQKLFAGDAATPEGMYEVTSARQRGSKYYKALLINYPNAADRKRFAENKAKGIISQRARIGNWIEIHGEGGKNKDWTQGCVALTNKDMDHIMQYVAVGTQVTIVRKSDQWP
jgi:L,D-peptidoglycan transpeptidase YkuD (ErfK/YbiS/YcfS/YnhG family)